MKKVLTVLAILLIVGVANAQEPITIDISANEGGCPATAEVTIGYSGATGAKPVGVSMIVTLTNATLAGTPANTVGDSFFDVFIDFAADDPNAYLAAADPCDGTWALTAHPVAKTDMAGSESAGVSAFALCMGELADPCNIAASNTLYTFPITVTATPVTVTVTLDELRGEIVDVNAATMTVAYPSPLEICASTACYLEGQPRGVCGDTITAANVTAWNTLNAVDQPIWCCDYQPCGDANGDGYVNPEDYLAIFANIGSTANLAPRADVNHDGYVNPEDYLTVFANIGQGDGLTCPQ